MTESQAHQFIARWSRRFVTWKARNEIEQLRDLERSCIGMSAGSFMILVMTASQVKGSAFLQVIAMVLGGQLLFSFVMLLRCREARRALDQSSIVNPKS